MAGPSNEDTSKLFMALAVSENMKPDVEPEYYVDDQGQYYYQSTDVQILILMDKENETLVRDLKMSMKTENHLDAVNFPPMVSDDELKFMLTAPQPGEEPNTGQIKSNNTADGGSNGSAKFEESDNDTEGSFKVRKKKLIFRCEYCGYCTCRRYLLLRHMKIHSDEKPHKCVICQRGFKTLAALQNHTNVHRGIKPYACESCDHRFTTSGELVRHTRYRHTHERPHRCPECEYASVERSKLRRHLAVHTGERPYQCQHCTYASPDSFKLKRHMRTHTGERPYACDACGATFTQSNSLKKHQELHDPSKRAVYACAQCSATCGRKTDLRIHVQKQHSYSPTACRRCGATLRDRHSMKLHSKSHKGEKCFKCDLCAYAAHAASRLRAHRLTHTGEKPYACQRCPAAFRQKQLLRRHVNTRHDPEYVPRPRLLPCDRCDRRFVRQGNLERHRRTHGPRPLNAPEANGPRVCFVQDTESENGQWDYPSNTTERELMTLVTDNSKYVIFEILEDSKDENGLDVVMQGSDARQISL